MYCPLRNVWKSSCAEQCMHNVDGKCLHKEHSSLADLPSRKRLSAVAELHNVSVREIAESVSLIQAVIVADAYADFILGKSLLDIDVAEFSNSLDEDKFQSWNKTTFTFSDVKTALNLID